MLAMTELEETLAQLLTSGRQLCWYCGTEARTTRYIIEHCTPRSRGGSDNAAHLVIACQSCNWIKGSRTLEEFRSLLEQRFEREVIFFGEIAGDLLSPPPQPDPPWS